MVNIQLKLKTAKGLFKEGFENLFKNRLLSFAAIITVSISLTIFGMFCLTLGIINENIHNMKENVNIVAFIENDIEEIRVNEIEAEIKELENVKSVRYISKEEGLESYKESLVNEGDEEMTKIIEELVEDEENPIPATFNITTINSEVNSEVKESLSSFSEVYKVNDGNVITSFLTLINRYTKNVALILMVILILLTIILISNSIKVAVFFRKKEISIIKYIGATNNFIRLPFVIEGFLIGTIGALISTILLIGLYSVVAPRILSIGSELIEGFSMQELGNIMVILIPIMFIIGIGVGVIGSLVSIRKYLKV